jgi:hypothetical protein
MKHKLTNIFHTVHSSAHLSTLLQNGASLNNGKHKEHASWTENTEKIITCRKLVLKSQNKIVQANRGNFTYAREKHKLAVWYDSGKTYSDKSSQAWKQFIVLKINITLGEHKNCGKSQIISVTSTHTNIYKMLECSVIAGPKFFET